MEITETCNVQTRSEWRAWLQAHHDEKKEIWLINDSRSTEAVRYLDAVEEAICFGWIDGIQKRKSEFESAQRFTPRRRRSNWTELNKERARRLVTLGLMTDKGYESLPDLESPFIIPEDILAAIHRIPAAADFFDSLPDLYKRVRIGYIVEVRRNQIEFQKRLDNFLRKTADRKMYGNWDDGGRLSQAVADSD